MMSSYIFPLSSGTAGSRVSFPFGATYSKTYLKGTKHKGVDLTPQNGGSPTILATIGGKVIERSYDASGYGNYCIIHGSDGYYHFYCHMAQAATVRIGDTVEAGRALGVMGSTGNVTGPHLHYEVRQVRDDRGTLINPCTLIGIINTEGNVKTTTNAPVSIASVGAGSNPAAPSNIPYEEMSPITGTEQSGDYLFGRRCRIIVSDDNGSGIDITNLHITFNVVKTYLMDMQYSIINIYNVNRDTESFVIRQGSIVTIEAGYEGANFSEIFTGDIIQSFGFNENGVDFVLRIIAVDSDRFLNEGFINFSMEKGITQRQALENIAAKAAVPSQINNISDGLSKSTLPRGKVFFGMAKDYMQQIAKSSNATLYMDNGQVNIIKATDPPDDRIFKLTPKSGLIGVPQQTEMGIKGKALLIPQIRVNRSIQIDNEYIQERQLAVGTLQTMLDSQGVYRIAKTTYIGDTRGNDWYVEFEAMTQAGYVPAMLQNADGNPF
jgi:hypothetical protein